MKLTQDILDRIRAAKASLDSCDSIEFPLARARYDAWLRFYAMELCDLAEDALAWRAEVESLERLERADTLPTDSALSTCAHCRAEPRAVREYCEPCWAQYVATGHELGYIEAQSRADE